MALTGFSSRKRPVSVRNFRNFVLRDGAAIGTCLFFFWGLNALDRAGVLGAMGVSEWVAAVTGSVLIFFAVLGTLAMASAHTGADLIDDEVAAEEMRERGRLFLYSFIWMAALGLLLIVLSLAGPGGVLSPAAALAGALVLIAVLTVLGFATWRLSDELMRTLSHEAGNMAFYLILVLGGGWAMLAHLGFVAAPAPLDWLTMFTVLCSWRVSSRRDGGNCSRAESGTSPPPNARLALHTKEPVLHRDAQRPARRFRQV